MTTATGPRPEQDEPAPGFMLPPGPALIYVEQGSNGMAQARQIDGPGGLDDMTGRESALLLALLDYVRDRLTDSMAAFQAPLPGPQDVSR